MRRTILLLLLLFARCFVEVNIALTAALARVSRYMNDTSAKICSGEEENLHQRGSSHL